MSGGETPRTGVVLAPNWLGDAVMCLPAVAALRRAWPECAWTVMARAAVAELFGLARLGVAVETLLQPPSLRVGRRSADVAVVFPNSFYAAALAWRLGARRRVGYARDGRGWLLTTAIPVPERSTTPAHESFYFLELARRAGLIAAAPREDSPAPRVPLHPDPETVAAWRRRLGPGPHVALHAGATFGTAKRWMPERFAALAEALGGAGVGVVLIGSRGERELAQQVIAMSGRANIGNLAGETTLAELAAVLRAVDVLVANDSGPMHLAGGVGTPVVALFGSTNERETYPLTEAGKLRLLKAPGVECSPCKRRECPIDHRCMTRLEVDEVFEAVRQMLAGARGEAI